MTDQYLIKEECSPEIPLFCISSWLDIYKIYVIQIDFIRLAQITELD